MKKNNSEIVINYPINFDKKTMKFVIDSNYKNNFSRIRMLFSRLF